MTPFIILLVVAHVVAATYGDVRLYALARARQGCPRPWYWLAPGSGYVLEWQTRHLG